MHVFRPATPDRPISADTCVLFLGVGKDAEQNCGGKKTAPNRFHRGDENGAVAAARTMGFGDRHKADEVAVEAMRKTMDAVQMDGTIVIGEGERDEAPMLYIGEKVGFTTR